MKSVLLVVLGAVISFVGLHLTANTQQEAGFMEMHRAPDAPVTLSMRQNDFALCGQPFYDDAYALTAEIFAGGAENVSLEEFERQLFALVRSSEEFENDPEAFVEHIQDIPRQLIEIIDEDPTVVDSCENFSVALVGPP